MCGPCDDALKRENFGNMGTYWKPSHHRWPTGWSKK